MATAEAFLAAIADDQYEWGEFGRSEEHAESPRTREQASAKPNFWISCQAAFALVALEGPEHPAVDRFVRWVEAERARDGWWTSQTGAKSPRGDSSPSVVHNLRHTAKALDLLSCRRALRASDAPIVEAVLDAGNADGSWPAYDHRDGEIWATAYVLNLLARLLHEPFDWLGLSNATLRSRISNGLSWLVEQRDAGLWSVDGQEPVFTTEAVLAEVGALLAQQRPDVCDEVAGELLSRLDEARRPTAVWALALTWRALASDLQARVADHAAALAQEDPLGDVVDLASGARLVALGGDVALAAWLGAEAGGHESALKGWQRWSTGEYHDWCLRRAAELDGSGLSGPPVDRGEAWRGACDLVEGWRAHVEHHWRGLWNGDEHADEAKIQTSFETFASGAQLLDRAAFAEVGTGRGPVDFVFVNGMRATVYMEFKRADHARLEHGATVQLPTYMNAAGTDAGLLICVSFDDDDIRTSAEIASTVKEAAGDKLFVRVIEVDARRKASASKA